MKYNLKHLIVIVTLLAIAIGWFCSRSTLMGTGPAFMIMSPEGKIESELPSSFRVMFYQRLSQELELQNPEIANQIAHKKDYLEDIIRIEKNNGTFVVNAFGNPLKSDDHIVKVLLDLSVHSLPDEDESYSVEVVRVGTLLH